MQSRHNLLWIFSIIVCVFVLVGCSGDFESSITPVAWSTVPPAPALNLDDREREVQDAIDAGNYQEAIELVLDLYGVDASSAPSIVYDENLPDDYYATTDPADGSIVIGPAAMASSEVLATTVGHEVVHANQIANGLSYLIVNEQGQTVVLDEQGIYLQELEAWNWELDNAQENGLSQVVIDEIEAAIEYYYNLLTPENQALADQDIYVLPELPSDLMTPSP